MAAWALAVICVPAAAAWRGTGRACVLGGRARCARASLGADGASREFLDLRARLEAIFAAPASAEAETGAAVGAAEPAAPWVVSDLPLWRVQWVALPGEHRPASE